MAGTAHFLLESVEGPVDSLVDSRPANTQRFGDLSVRQFLPLGEAEYLLSRT